jgi:hypothetical protein
MTAVCGEAIVVEGLREEVDHVSAVADGIADPAGNRTLARLSAP